MTAIKVSYIIATLLFLFVFQAYAVNTPCASEKKLNSWRYYLESGLVCKLLSSRPNFNY